MIDYVYHHQMIHVLIWINRAFKKTKQLIKESILPRVCSRYTESADRSPLLILVLGEEPPVKVADMIEWLFMTRLNLGCINETVQ